MQNEFLSVLLELNLCLVMGYLLYHLLFRNNNRHYWNRIFLIGWPILSLLIATAQINWTVWKAVDTQNIVSIHTIEEIPTPGLEGMVSGLSSSSNEQTESSKNQASLLYFWQQNWAFIYWIGALVLALIFLFRLVHLRHLIHHSTPIQKEKYTLLEHPNLQSIFSFGRYIFNPKGRSIHPMILEHELVHIRQRHSMDLLWMELLVIFCWFNPFIYLYRKNLKETHEFIADQSVVQQYGLLEYARLLVSQASSQKSPALGTPFAAFTKKRILTMKTKSINPWSRLRYGLILPLFLILMTAFALKRVEKERPVPVAHEATVLSDNQVAAQVKWGDMTCDCFKGELEGSYLCDIKTVSRKQLQKLSKQIPSIKMDGQAQSLLATANQYTATIYRSDSKKVGLPVEFSTGFFSADDLFWRKLNPGDKIKFRAILGNGNVIEFPFTLEDKQTEISIPSSDDHYSNFKIKEEKIPSTFDIMFSDGFKDLDPNFQLPIQQKLIQKMSSGYGRRIHPITKKEQFHRGVDFTAPLGTIVKSSGQGEVIQVERLTTGYGNHIIIQHAEGYQTLYAQLQSINVNVGEKVSTGQHIGTVGSSGRSTGPHLHFELLKDDKPLDPEKFLPSWKSED